MNIKDAYAQHKTLKIMRETIKELETKFKGFGCCLLVFEFEILFKAETKSDSIRGISNPTVIN